MNGDQTTNTPSGSEIKITAAKQAAIDYLKQKYELDVEITNEEMMPSIVANKVNFEGHVVGHPEQTFKISVDYNTEETSNVVMSPELKQAIEAD
ncbi:hypothetical protein JCM10914A_27180 [Paenibacillus sp. JCM 10914]|uniref:hypothetical protein n=1 Tax=Paenibacillus sp. JCM 10914 TaxID=1236974 RepID=UPI0003CCAE50|nr:hypothetical protein [Paenibacillus sp. JCM 10914]GAE08232.1 hypothetical protein JCM10914_4522 [Paenibacillus sp. JCM 10914]